MRRRLPGSLADGLVAVSQMSEDTTSVEELAQRCGMSVRTLQSRCREARVRAKACVDFVRCVRIVCDTQHRWAPRAQLARAGLDRRTIERLVAAGALDSATRPTLSHFLDHQRFIRSSRLLEEIRSAFRAHRSTRARTPSLGQKRLTNQTP